MKCIFTLILTLLSFTSLNNNLIVGIPNIETKVTIEYPISLIKGYERLHLDSNSLYIGYGHYISHKGLFRVLKDSISTVIMLEDLEAKRMVFEGNKIEVLLAILSYNIGESKVIKSNIHKLSNKDSIKAKYLSFNRFNGVIHKGLSERRIKEWNWFISHYNIWKNM